jgi:thioredoxin reductase (NADPH)
MQKEKVIIIGSGPAGLTAALYTARATLNPLVFVGSAFGGQAALTHEIENYPGFVEAISGPELAENMLKQAQRFGARFEYAEVQELDFSQGSPFKVTDYNGQVYQAESVILAVGATARRLGIPGEEKLIGMGVSYCATCDGFFFRGKDVVVVGGGDSAVEEALFLTRFATSVTIIHRRDTLRAGATAQARAFANEKIRFIWDTVVEEILGESNVTGVRLKNLKTEAVSEMPTDGVFVFIGHDPNNSIIGGQLAMKDGYVVVDAHMMTSVPGVFAAGEIMDPIYRQVATSVGQGCAAAMSAGRWLEERASQPEERERVTVLKPRREIPELA